MPPAANPTGKHSDPLPSNWHLMMAHMWKLDQPCFLVSPITPETIIFTKNGQLSTRSANPLLCYDNKIFL